jgi:hypothetical protein
MKAGRSPNSLVRKAYVEQTSLGWNLRFRGFWSISWRKAQDFEFSTSPYHRGHTDNGESWACRAQVWMFDLFDLPWGMRNANEHGADLQTQRLCERAIRRLYHAGDLLPFRDPIDDVFSKSLCKQERWVTLTEEYLPGAAKRVKDQQQTGQRSLTAYAGWSRTPPPSQYDDRDYSLPFYSGHQPGTA